MCDVPAATEPFSNVAPPSLLNLYSPFPLVTLICKRPILPPVKQGSKSTISTCKGFTSGTLRVAVAVQPLASSTCII